MDSKARAVNYSLKVLKPTLLQGSVLEQAKIDLRTSWSCDFARVPLPVDMEHKYLLDPLRWYHHHFHVGHLRI